MWENYFASNIIDRGYEYYLDNKVKILSFFKGEVFAVVHGSDHYHVSIVLNGNEPISMECNCPYAGSGLNCKHMAAVLFEIADEEDLVTDEIYIDSNDKSEYENTLDTDNVLNSDTSEVTKEGIETLIGCSDLERVKDFLVEALLKDSALLARFKIALHVDASEDQIQAYKDEVDKYISTFCKSVRSGNAYRYNQGYGNNYYNSLRDLQSSLDLILQDGVDYLTEKKYYAQSLKLLFHILRKACDIPSGYDPVRIEITKKCINNFNFIADQSKDCMGLVLREIVQYVIDEPANLWNVTLYNYVLRDFKDSSFVPDKIKLVKHYLDKYAQSENGRHDHYVYESPHIGRMHGQRGETLVTDYINLLNEDKVANKEELKVTFKKYAYIKEVKEMYLQHCIDTREYREAAVILEDTIPNYYKSYKKANMSIKLKDIYKELDNRDMYLNELWLLATNYKIGDSDIYRELKEQYTEQDWKKERIVLYKLYSQRRMVHKFYANEKLDGLLLEYILDTGRDELLATYEGELAINYSREILNMYENILQNKVRSNANRKIYMNVVETLRHMKTFRGGEQKVLQIVDKWNYKYSNRPAMMEELRKL